MSNKLQRGDLEAIGFAFCADVRPRGRYVHIDGDAAGAQLIADLDAGKITIADAKANHAARTAKAVRMKQRATHPATGPIFSR